MEELKTPKQHPGDKKNPFFPWKILFSWKISFIHGISARFYLDARERDLRFLGMFSDPQILLICWDKIPFPHWIFPKIRDFPSVFQVLVPEKREKDGRKWD